MNIIWFDLFKFAILSVLAFTWYWRVFRKRKEGEAFSKDKLGWACFVLVIVGTFFQPVMLEPKNAVQTIRTYDKVEPVVIQEIKRQPVITHKPSDNAEDVERITQD